MGFTAIAVQRDDDPLACSKEEQMERRVETYAVEERIRSSLENLVFALGEMAGADRASLFVVDEINAYESELSVPALLRAFRSIA
jgi:hypothetical protein